MGWYKQEIPPDTLILERLRDVYDLGTLSLANLTEIVRRVLRSQPIDEYMLHHLLYGSGSAFLEAPLVQSVVEGAPEFLEAQKEFGQNYFLDFSEVINRTYRKTMDVMGKYLHVMGGVTDGARNLDSIFFREGIYYRINPEYRVELLTYLTHILNLMIIIVDAYLHKAELLSLKIPETFRDTRPETRDTWSEVFNTEMPALFTLLYRSRSTLDEAIGEIL